MVETSKFDVQSYLKTPEERAAYLDALLEDGDPSFLARGLLDIAEAIGQCEFSRQTGLSMDAIPRELAPGGDPTVDTIIKVTRALGLQLTVKPIDP